MLKNLNFFYLLSTLVIVFTGFIIWKYMLPDSKFDNAALQLMDITKDIRKHYINKASYWGLSTKYLVDNNILTNLSYDDGRLVNALGKKVEIGQSDNGDAVLPGEKSFVVAYKRLSNRECIALAAYRFAQPEELGLLSITIKNKDNNQVFDWGEGDYTLPINRQTAKRFCRNDSTVLWTIE